jgi:nucleoside-diphosphate-sugar epimerase
MPPAFRPASVSSLLRSDPVELTGRHILVTGGTGFLGRSILDYLGESAARYGARFHVTVISRTPERFLRERPAYAALDWLSVLPGDINHLPAVDSPPTDVIHAAGDSHRGDSQLQWIDQIAGGTRAALDWAVRSGAQRFLFTSSGAVYGRQPESLARLPETFAGAPPPTESSSVYGQAKRLAEQLCTLYRATHGLETIIARCFAFTSPYVPLDGPYAIGNFIRDALRSDVIRVRGDGRAVRTYLFGRDMAHWLVTMLTRGAAGEAYNVGSDQPLTMAELAATVASVVSPGKAVVIENSLTDAGARSIYVPDVGKARSLGLQVEVELPEAIRLSVDARNA